MTQLRRIHGCKLANAAAEGSRRMHWHRACLSGMHEDGALARAHNDKAKR
jgi:hypothetical protein